MSLSTGIDWVKEHGPVICQKTYAAVVNGFIFGEKTWLSRKVENLTANHFKPATARLVAEIIKSSPFIVTALFAPPPVTFGIFLACGIARFIKDTKVQPLVTAIGIAACTGGIAVLAKSIFRKSIALVPVSGVLLGIGAVTLLLGDRKFISTAIEAMKEAYASGKMGMHRLVDKVKTTAHDLRSRN